MKLSVQKHVPSYEKKCEESKYLYSYWTFTTSEMASNETQQGKLKENIFPDKDYTILPMLVADLNHGRLSLFVNIP